MLGDEASTKRNHVIFYICDIFVVISDSNKDLGGA